MIRMSLILRRQLHIISKAMGQVFMILCRGLIGVSLKLNIQKPFKHINIHNIDPTN